MYLSCIANVQKTHFLCDKVNKLEFHVSSEGPTSKIKRGRRGKALLFKQVNIKTTRDKI